MIGRILERRGAGAVGAALIMGGAVALASRYRQQLYPDRIRRAARRIARALGGAKERLPQRGLASDRAAAPRSPDALHPGPAIDYDPDHRAQRPDPATSHGVAP